MPFPATRAMPYRAITLALAGMTTLTTTQGASADDGLGGFFSSIFGGGAANQQAPAPASGTDIPKVLRSDIDLPELVFSPLPLLPSSGVDGSTSQRSTESRRSAGARQARKSHHLRGPHAQAR